MMGERGFEINHATLNRWVLQYAPQLEQKAKKGSVAKLNTAAAILPPGIRLDSGVL